MATLALKSSGISNNVWDGYQNTDFNVSKLIELLYWSSQVMCLIPHFFHLGFGLFGFLNKT